MLASGVLGFVFGKPILSRLRLFVHSFPVNLCAHPSSMTGIHYIEPLGLFGERVYDLDPDVCRLTRND